MYKKSLVYFLYLSLAVLWSCKSSDNKPAGSITVLHTDIDRKPGGRNMYYSVRAGVKLPEEGQNMVWDYSNLQFSGEFSSSYTNVPAAAKFTNAQYAIYSQFYLLGAIGPFDSYNVFRLDEKEWSRLGIYIDAKGDFLIPGQEVGSTIGFQGGSVLYDKSNVFLAFPQTYGKKIIV